MQATVVLYFGELFCEMMYFDTIGRTTS